ncbi:MAG: hypothetical protein ACRDVZ_15785 [Jiangellaceae bacterium]
MVASALILVGLAVLLIAAVVSGDGQSLTVELFGVDVETSVAGLFLTGVVTGVVTLLAFGLLRAGLHKGWRQRKRLRELERRARAAEAERPPVDEAEPVDEAKQADNGLADQGDDRADDADPSGNPHDSTR